MSKPKDKGTTEKPKRPKKLSDFFLILRDLYPGEQFTESPPTFTGEFRFARQAACRAHRRYGVLREGVLYLYVKKDHAIKNTNLWRSVDSSKSHISYRAKDRKVLFETTEQYRLQVGKESFQQWVDSLRSHRLYAQFKAQDAKNVQSSDIAVVNVTSADAGVPFTSVPVVMAAAAPDGPKQKDPRSRAQPQLAAVQDGAKKATIPLFVAVVASSQQDNLKKASVPAPPKFTAWSVNGQPKHTASSVKHAQMATAEQKPPATIAYGPHSTKTPATVATELFMREPESATNGTGKLIPVPVSFPASISKAPSFDAETYSRSPVKVVLVRGVSIQPFVKSTVSQPVTAPGQSAADKMNLDQPVTSPTTASLPVKDKAEKSKLKEVDGSKQKTSAEPEPRLSKDDSIASEGESSSQTTPKPTQQAVQPMRSKLPAPMNPPPSLFRLIMSAIGRDVMRMAMPASIMEPLGTLQLFCEELEYADLIERALTKTNPQWRLLYIAAFAVSRYGSTAKRAGRKPFNPLLSETYEFVNPMAGWHFLAEQVSHHPPVTACYAEGNGWRFWQDCELIASLSTTAVKATPLGMVYLNLEKLGETYVWNKVISQVTGILSGNYIIDHVGEMTVSCQQTKMKCKLNFKRIGVGRRGDVEGRLLDEKGSVLCRVYANWTEAFFVGAPDDPQSTCIWRLAEMPPDYEKYFGFSRFTLGLNEIRPDIHGVLPKTDTRYRPDQRALENGKVDEAEKLKRELEDKQRQRRKVNEAQKNSHTPLWFRPTGNSDPAAGSRWQFTGTYWQSKKEQFKGVEFIDLW